MKAGGSDSPFDHIDDEENDDQSEPETMSQSATETDETAQTSSEQYPLKLRRSGVKDEREMTQFFLQRSTEKDEDRKLSDLEDILDEDVFLTDFREAGYLAGMQNLEDTAAILRDWGYDLD